MSSVWFGIKRGDFNLSDYEIPIISHLQGDSRTVIIPRIETDYVALDPAMFNTRIQNIIDCYNDADGDLGKELWYRGHSKKAYKLLPSLFRKYTDRLINSPPSSWPVSLPQYQRALVESFLFRSRDAAELRHTAALRGNAQIEYLAEMQHYSVPTNLLDWTENPFVSLHFATTKKKSTIDAASIFVFNPYLYNRVRREIILYFDWKYSDVKDDVLGRNTESCEFIGSVVPNIGAHYLSDYSGYSDFIFGPIRWPSFQKSDLRASPFSDNAELPDHERHLLPLAVTVPRSSFRDKAQMGNFLAFNLCSLPAWETPATDAVTKTDYFGGLQYLDLKNIQNFYLNSPAIKGISTKYTKQKLPFLFQINIPASDIHKFQSFLGAINVRESSFYPELYRIGDEIANNITV